MNTPKAYSSFSDKYGKQYAFANYIDFAQFWFALPRTYAKSRFPDFDKLNKAAVSSKEARTRLY